MDLIFRLLHVDKYVGVFVAGYGVVSSDTWSPLTMSGPAVSYYKGPGTISQVSKVRVFITDTRSLSACIQHARLQSTRFNP